MSRVLVTGANGQLGTDVVLAATQAGHEVFMLDRREPDPVDVTDARAVERCIAAARPDLVVHAAAWTAVDACEHEPDRAMAVNAGGTAHVADAAAAVGAHVLYVSTDYVFDGTKPTPYVETDPTNPLSSYGRSKLAGEHALSPDSTVVRISWVCGAHGANMVKTILRLAAEPGPLRFVDDQRGQPTFTADVAPALVELGLERPGGIWHLTNEGAVSWYEFARAVLQAAGDDPDRVEPIATTDLHPPRPAPRPTNSVLDNAAWRASGRVPLRPFTEPLEELVRDLSRSDR